jgi:argonaute-like protein implicated in RNA metabolism and viral defense
LVFVKFVNTQHAKQTYQYMNTKEKLYTTNAAILYNKMCKKIASNLKNIICCEYSVKTPDDGQ